MTEYVLNLKEKNLHKIDIPTFKLPAHTKLVLWPTR